MGAPSDRQKHPHRNIADHLTVRCSCTASSRASSLVAVCPWVGQEKWSLVKVALQRDPHMTLFQRVRPPFPQDPLDDETMLASGPRSAGEVLRQRREELGLGLGDIAAALKIKPPYLAAL